MSASKKSTAIPSDCWQKIGFEGDRSCPNLVEFVHCHSCPVFAQAGLSLYDRELPEGYSREWAAVLSQEKQVLRKGVIGAVAFRLGNERLALNAKYFDGVFDPRPVRIIPHRSDKLLKGLTVVQGEIVPAVSVRELLGIADESGKGERNGEKAGENPVENGRGFRRFIAVSRDGERFVFGVDEVSGLIRFSLDEPENVPVTLAKSPASYTRGILERDGLRVNLLDEELFFNALRRCVG